MWDALRDAARNDFYPRPPRGGRQDALDFLFEVLGFLSTPSARRATIQNPVDGLAQHISIHALREEGDEHKLTERDLEERFLSTPSARRATKDPELFMEYYEFLSTPSARRATSTSSPRGTSRNDFYPRPPRGGRPRTRSSSWSITNFYPRPPRGGRPLCASALA